MSRFDWFTTERIRTEKAEKRSNNGRTGRRIVFETMEARKQVLSMPITCHLSFHFIQSNQRHLTGFLSCLHHSYAPYTDGQIMPGVFQNCYQNREAKITKSFCSGIINLLFDGFTYNTRRHFAHCSQLAKYPRVLYVKPSNKIYVLLYCKYVGTLVCFG